MQTFQIQFSDSELQKLGISDNPEKSQALQAQLQEIGQLLIWLDEMEKTALLKALRRQILLTKAVRLDQSTLPNRINMDLIVEEVRNARAARHEAG